VVKGLKEAGFTVDHTVDGEEGLCRLTGYTAEELVQFAWMDVTPAKALDQKLNAAYHCNANEKCYEGETQQRQRRICW
jgi:hypothetical protein